MFIKRGEEQYEGEWKEDMREGDGENVWFIGNTE